MTSNFITHLACMHVNEMLESVEHDKKLCNEVEKVRVYIYR